MFEVLTGMMPTRATALSAGYDLYSTMDITLLPGVVNRIPLGIKWGEDAPWDIYGRISPKSGLANSNGVDVLAGVIDRDYALEWVLLLSTLTTCHIVLGQKVAQVILSPFHRGEEVSVTRVGGFGSTGIK